MNNAELKTEETIAAFQKKIIEIISKTEDVKYLEFIYKLLLSFKKKWGV